MTGAAGISLLGRQGRLWHVHRAHLMHPAGTPAAMLPLASRGSEGNIFNTPVDDFCVAVRLVRAARG